MKWFKFYGQDWLTDLKVMKMKMEDRLCLITLFCLASAADKAGLIKSCDEESLIRLSNLPNDPTHEFNPAEEAKGCLERYAALQIVTLLDNGDVIVRNFERRQAENLSNAERQKNYRERLKTKGLFSNDSDVTQDNDRYARIDKNRIDKNIHIRSFDLFWKEYPSKVAKKKALQSWLRLSPDEKHFNLIMTSLRKYIKSEQWLKDDGRFVPHPTTWLNQGRWEDEIPVRIIKETSTVLA